MAPGSSSDIADFATLLEFVAELPGIERIRYTTSHPKEFGQRLIDAYGRIDKLVDHVHLPVQHGSDRILAAMKRGYTSLEFRSTVRKLRAARPGISISSDFIVGFPGESEADFERTMALVEDIGFDHSFSFVFSPRPGTPAAGLADETPAEVKLARLQRLQGRSSGAVPRSVPRAPARCGRCSSRVPRAATATSSPGERSATASSTFPGRRRGPGRSSMSASTRCGDTRCAVSESAADARPSQDLRCRAAVRKPDHNRRVRRRRHAA